MSRDAHLNQKNWNYSGNQKKYHIFQGSTISKGDQQAYYLQDSQRFY